MTSPLHSRSPHGCSAALASLAALAAALAPSLAFAQQTGFTANRFDPAEKGSDWFENESLDYRGTLRPAVGILGDYSKDEVVIRNPDGSSAGSLIANQYYLHVGASVALINRLRLDVDIPIELGETGTSATTTFTTGSGLTTAQTFNAPGSAAFGDIRLGGDVRLWGEYEAPFRIAVGALAYLPTGSTAQFTGDGKARVQPRVLIAGDADVFTYSFRMGYEVRGGNSFEGIKIGDELTWGAAVGLRLVDKKLLFGPEFTVNTLAENAFKATTTPSELLLGVHYRFTDWRIGGGAGTAFDPGQAVGSPTVRVLLGVEWQPGIPEKVVTVADRDEDGIPDEFDACPDAPGAYSEASAVDGCPPPPPPDRDHDGVVDGDDACPDVAGIKTSDPKTNGCPPDRDRDSVVDSEDACPDVPGVKTPDAKTNGCPPVNPDRDNDGIKNEADACPDVPGLANDDPTKNGCPLARVEGGQIKITEQVKFAENSARLLKESDAVLNAVLEILDKHREINKVKIEGYSDNKGQAAYNKTLSGQRAASVRAWLLLHKVDAKRLESAGYGADRPIDSNGTDLGRQNNRRVEFHIADETPASAPAATPPAGAAPAAAKTP